MKKVALLFLVFVGLASCKETVAERIMSNMKEHPTDWVYQKGVVKKDTTREAHWLDAWSSHYLCDTIANKSCGVKIILDPNDFCLVNRYDIISRWRLVVPDTLKFTDDESEELFNCYQEDVVAALDAPRRKRQEEITDSINLVAKKKLELKEENILSQMCK